MPSGPRVGGITPQKDSPIESDCQRRRNGDVTQGDVSLTKVISPCDDDGPSRLARVPSQCSSARFLRTPSRGRNEEQDGVVNEDSCVLITQWSDRDQYFEDDVTSGGQSSEGEYDLSSRSNSCTFEPGDIDQEDGYDTDLEVDDKKWLLANQGDFDPSGLKDYIAECNKLGVIPASYFARHVHDKAFVMKHYQLGPRGAKAIAKPFEVNTTIEKIDLEGNHIGNRGCVYLARVLKDNLYVNELILSENNIGSIGAAAISEMMLENSTISTLEVSGNGFRDCDGRYFSQILESNTTLQKLSMKHNQFDDDTAMHFRDALAGNEFLRMLDLSWNHFRMKGAEYLADIIKENYGLKYLNLAMNGLADDGAKLIGQALKANQCLVDLNISSNRITTEGAIEIARGIEVNETLQTLRIGQNPISADGAVSLLEAIHKNTENTALTLLDINNVVVSDKFEKLHEHINTERPNIPFLQVVHGGVLFRGKHLIYIDENEPELDFESDTMGKLRKYAEKTKYRLIDVFKQFDTDNSWSLSRNEILKGGQSKGIDISEKEVDKFIAKLDKNGDGEIDFAELLAGDDEFRKEQRDQKKDLTALAVDRSQDDEEETGERKGRKVALALGERDEFTTDT